MIRREFGWADSILSRTVLLLVATVLLLTLVNVGIILLRAPPSNAPLTAQELARVIQGRPIAKQHEAKLSASVSLPPQFRAGSTVDLVGLAIAKVLRRPPEDVRVVREPARVPGPDFQKQLRREYELYNADGQFNPSLFGPFQIAVRQRDGSWLLLQSTSPNPFANWQLSTIVRFLLSVLVVIPIAWIFARRLAEPIRSFGVAADRIGRRRQAEAVKVEGPAEIRQAAKAINEMQLRLQGYVAERASMVGAIAHDLRTPLSRLNFHLANAPDALRAKAEAEMNEMEEMIAATLDFVRSEGQQHLREPVDLALLVEGVVDDFADLGHDVQLSGVMRATILGDAILLKRLFANLLTNALTYGTRAEVALTVAAGKARVVIADEGPGLRDEDLQRVFEPFYRGESSRNRATGGLGLGLAIVKAAASAHDAEIRISNRMEGGLLAEFLIDVLPAIHPA